MALTMPDPVSDLGLYYPYFHVRDERWLKMSALYWPAIVRIVPEDYAIRDSRTVRVLADQAGFIENASPAAAVDAIAPRFLELLAGNEGALRAALRVQQRDMAAFDRTASGTSATAPHRPRLAALHESQVRPDLTRALVEAGLAVRGRLTLSHEVDARWLVLRERFVSLYMSCLAEEFGSVNHLELTTDQPHAFALANGWSADLLAGYLLRTPAPTDAQAGPSLAERIGILALGLVVPADIDRVSAEQIVRLRRHHGREFLAFRRAVGQAAAELASLADIPDGRTLDAHLRNEVNNRFALPLNELRQCLAGMKLDTATAAVNVRTQLPAGVTLTGGAWLAGQTLVAGAVAAGFGLLAIGHTSRQARSTALAAAGPAAYLLHTGKALSERRLLSRTLHQMAGIASPAVRG
ncbi:hypothetical protein DDQ41_30735 [Streptomyces spongiicola]|uniref:DUF2236 domain-containing protein n=2 Tax=Streptomyces spongiicola TaxID=1690221 RepID=A0ABN5KUY6_9ACTN|nr:hypothetical protein DDQ41_30735 [Streptomyces spongiicola]